MPDDYQSFDSPLSDKSRKEFLDLFIEYRENFSKKPTRELFFIEKLSPANFVLFRINKWLNLAQKKEAESYVDNKKVFLDNEFLDLYEKALKELVSGFSNRKMIWCHGHVKPHEIFTNKARTSYYLIDFAHTAYFPEGYELAFIIWADFLMDKERWTLDFTEWQKDFYSWMDDIKILARKLNFNNSDDLIRVNLIERILGTILADIISSDKDDDIKGNGIRLMTLLLKELLS